MSNQENEQDARVDTMGDGNHSPNASGVVADAGNRDSCSHTPGPWKVIGPTGFIFTVGDPYGHGQMHVAQVRGWGHLTGKGGGCAFDDDKAMAIQDATARLIAAAPELLEACADALGTITHHPDWKDEQSRWPVKQTIDKLRAAIAKAEGHAGEEGR